jgi:hypothetical protein
MALTCPKAFEPQEDGRKVHPIGLLRFPGYIFVSFDKVQQQHGPIGNTRGVGSCWWMAPANPNRFTPAS